MMMSLFENFDPMMSMLNMNTMSILTILLVPTLNMMSYNKYSRYTMMMKKISMYMYSELKTSFNNPNSKMKTFILLTTFFMILILNTCGLIPYVFTISSQMTFTLTLALPFWASTILYMSVHNINNFLSHLVPLSTPIMLSQFMVLIESVSQLIRPITLSVRLCANMTAGHILLTLTSMPISVMNQFSIMLFMLMMLEIAVALIQSYVFTMLISMYLAETI